MAGEEGISQPVVVGINQGLVRGESEVGLQGQFIVRLWGPDLGWGNRLRSLKY
jgi:hypothetical protein